MMFPFGIPGFSGEPSDLPGELYDEVETLYITEVSERWYEWAEMTIHDWQEEKEDELRHGG